MNISQMIRHVIGDMHLSDAKSLELKVGQVVRGVVLQMMSEQDALVNIGGVPVRARLEAPLSQGQATLLQVQPEKVPGQVILKPLESSGVQIAERSLPDLLKGFELRDSAVNRNALQELHQGQVPLTKETVKAYTEVIARVPNGIQEGQWREAALLAVRRGLPVSQETVEALNRLLFGKPLNHALQEMSELLARSQTVEGGQESLSASAKALIGQTRQALELLQSMTRPLAGEVNAGGAASALPGVPQSANDGAAASMRGPVLGQALQANGEAVEQSQQPGNAAKQSLQAEAGATAASSGRQDTADSAKGLEQLMGRQAPASEQEQWVPRLLKALGVEHEQQLGRLAGNGNPGSTEGASTEASKAAETLKSLLLSLSAADEAPAQIRESARQLVMQITGQQLLLSPDQSSMFSHMTLMLPLFNKEGSQTAAIHIQSKKGSRGELDAANCHLIFDLNMKSLGSTIVDVQVTDKIVGLRVHNDFPAVRELLEELREEMKEGLEKVGYQLLSMKVLPYPEVPAAGGQRLEQGTGQAYPSAPALRGANPYHTKPYKGMDVRV